MGGPLRIGVAGLRRGQSYLRVFSERADCQVTAICDTSPDLLNEIGDQWDVPSRQLSFEDLVATDVDVVVVATPGPDHAGQAILALDAGCHVLSEVPAVWTLEECALLVEAVEKSGRIYTLAENMCYFHYIREWRERIQNGEIGRITYAEAEYVHDCRDRMAAGNWRKEMPPMQYCTHSLGPVLDILQDRCIQAIGLSTGNQTSPEYAAADLEVGLFTTEKRVTIKILCGFAVCREPAFHWQVFYGTEGVIENGRPPDDSAKMYRSGDPEMSKIGSGVTDPDDPDAVTSGHGNSEFLLCDDFVGAVRGERPNPIDVYKGIEMSLPGICAHTSALSGGKPVQIPNFRP
jgi:predicted dehydrogenase